MMEPFSKKACRIILGISPCTWQQEECDCIYLTSGKNPCGLDSENFKSGGHKESHRQKPPTLKQLHVKCSHVPQLKTLLSLLIYLKEGGGPCRPGNADPSRDPFVHGSVIRDRPEQGPDQRASKSDGGRKLYNSNPTPSFLRDLELF